MLSRVLHREAYASPMPAPPVFSLDQARTMTVEQRHTHAREVRAWLTGVYFSSERDRHAQHVVEEVIEDNLHGRPGAGELAIVIGDNEMGKSVWVERAAAHWHRDRFGPGQDSLVSPRWRPPGGGMELQHCPVVVVSLPGNTTLPKFREALMEAMGYATGAKASPAQCFWECGTQVLLIDDVHFLVTSPKKGADVL